MVSFCHAAPRRAGAPFRPRLQRWGPGFLILLLLALLPGSPAAAADAEPAPLAVVVATLEKGYAELRDLQAAFTQRTTLTALKREEKGAGELFLKRPASGTALLRFVYHKPKQEIIVDGKNVWFYLPENRQVLVSDLAAVFAGGNGVALQYLTGLGTISRDFTISFIGNGRDKNGNYLLELVPRTPSPMLAKLQLTVAAEAVARYRETGTPGNPFPLLASTVHDPLGNRTAIEFSKVRTNRGISNERFTFKVPPGVDVIRP